MPLVGNQNKEDEVRFLVLHINNQYSRGTSRRRTGWYDSNVPFRGLLEGAGVEEQTWSEHTSWIPTNGEVLKWYLVTMKNSPVTEDSIKKAALEFFGKELKYINKRTIAKRLSDFKRENDNIRKKLSRVIQKSNEGKGNHFMDPPDSFKPEVETKIRRQMFLKLCKEEIDNHEEYKKWEAKLINVTQLNEENVTVPKLLKENKTLTEIINEKSSNETVKLVRERSSGPNIHDTEKIVLSKNSDGKVRKRLVLETVATITTRTRRK